MIQINENNEGQAKLKLAIIEPSSMNLKFDISNIVLDNKVASKDGDYFVWDSSPINLGSLSISGDLKLPSDSPINYDATDHANIKVIIIGEASKSSIPSDYQDDFNIENGDLIYTTDSLEVNVSQEDIDTIKDGIIDLDQTYLETIINNETGLELGAEIYISSDKSNLYNTENKINERLLEITSNQNETKRFLLKNTLEEVEKTLTEGEIYTGIKFIAGKLDDNKGNEIQFTNNMSLNIKSSVAVKLRINQ